MMWIRFPLFGVVSSLMMMCANAFGIGSNDKYLSGIGGDASSSFSQCPPRLTAGIAGSMLNAWQKKQPARECMADILSFQSLLCCIDGNRYGDKECHLTLAPPKYLVAYTLDRIAALPQMYCFDREACPTHLIEIQVIGIVSLDYMQDTGANIASVLDTLRTCHGGETRCTVDTSIVGIRQPRWDLVMKLDRVAR